MGKSTTTRRKSKSKKIEIGNLKKKTMKFRKWLRSKLNSSKVKMKKRWNKKLMMLLRRN